MTLAAAQMAACSAEILSGRLLPVTAFANFIVICGRATTLGGRWSYPNLSELESEDPRLEC
jgi:hypothetical protein